jgi:hypothetical protein
MREYNAIVDHEDLSQWQLPGGVVVVVKTWTCVSVNMATMNCNGFLNKKRIKICAANREKWICASSPICGSPVRGESQYTLKINTM